MNSWTWSHKWRPARRVSRNYEIEEDRSPAFSPFEDADVPDDVIAMVAEGNARGAGRREAPAAE